MANEIGSVSVRVRPDTSKFASEAKKDLERIEKRLKLTVQAELDYRSLKKSALEGLRTLNAELKTSDKYAVQFRAAISEIGMRSAVKKAARELNTLAKAEQVKFKVSIDNVHPDNVLIKAELDNASLTKVNTAINAYIRGISPKTVWIDTKLNLASAAKTDVELATLTHRRSVSIGADVDHKSFLIARGAIQALTALSGLRLSGGIFREFRDFFSTLDKKIPLIGSLAIAMAGLAGSVLDAASNTFALSRALAQIGPGALALPGIFGGIAIGVGATIAVFKDFNKVLPDVKNRLSAIQQSMSAKFWGVAKQPISDMINKLLPKFAAGLDTTASKLGTFFGNLAGSLSGALGGSAIANMFKDLNTSIVNMSKHTDAIASLFRIFGQAGSGRLPELANWIGKLTEDFNKFMVQAEKTGKLDKWINTSITRIKELGGVVKNAALFFAGIARAADNANGKSGDALGGLSSALQTAQKVVNGTNFQAKLTGVLSAASTMMDNISNGAGPSFEKFWNNFAGTLQTILPKVGSTIGTVLDGIYSMLGSAPVQNGLVALFDGLAKGVEKLRPAFDVLAPKLGAVLTLIGEMGNQFGGVLSSVIQAVAPVATALATALTPVVAKLGPLMSKVFKDLSPIFEQVGKNIGKVGKALLPLVDSLGKLWQVIGPLLIPVLKVVLTILGQTLVAVIQGVTLAINGVVQVVQGLVAVFTGVWNLIVGIFTLNGGKIKAAFGQIFGGLVNIVVGIFKVIVGVVWAYLNANILGIFRGGLIRLLSFWKGGWTKMADVFKGAWVAVKTYIRDGWAFIRGRTVDGIQATGTLMARIVEVITYPYRQAFELAKGIVTGAWSAIKGFFSGGISGVVARMKTLPGKVLKALGNLRTFLLDSGKALLAGFKDGIVNGFTDATNAVKDGLGNIRKFFPFSPAKKGPFSGRGYTTYSGRALMKDFGNGIVDGSKDALAKTQTVSQQISAALSQALSNQKKNKAKAVRASMMAIGRLIALGIKDGLDHNSGIVKSALTSMLSKIPKDLSKKSRNIITTMRNAMLTKLQDWTDVKKALADKLQEIADTAEQFGQQIRDSITAIGDPTQINQDGGAVTFQQITDHLQKAVDKAKAFSDLIVKLRGLKLNNDTLLQLLNAGPEAGLAAAQSIADAGKAGVDQINALQAQLANAAKDVGVTAQAVMYDNGMNMAKGLIDGLRRQQAALEAVMVNMANAMIKALKKALKIHSPSRVMRQMGVYTGTGFALGVKDTHDDAEKAIKQLAQARPGGINITAAQLGSGVSQVNNKTFIYNAPSGAGSLSGEEALFTALNRARSSGF